LLFGVLDLVCGMIDGCNPKEAQFFDNFFLCIDRRMITFKVAEIATADP
jgi:hypothetical protein